MQLHPLTFCAYAQHLSLSRQVLSRTCKGFDFRTTFSFMVPALVGVSTARGINPKFCKTNTLQPIYIYIGSISNPAPGNNLIALLYIINNNLYYNLATTEDCTVFFDCMTPNTEYSTSQNRNMLMSFINKILIAGVLPECKVFQHKQGGCQEQSYKLQ